MGKMIKPILEDGASDPKTYQRKGVQAGDPRSRAVGIRFIYLGKPKSRAAGIRKAQWPAISIRPITRGSNVRRTSSTPAPSRTSSSRTSSPGSSIHLGKKKFFIVGSNYIYPREMAKVCKILIEAEWRRMGRLTSISSSAHSEWGAMVNKIKEFGCDVVLSNVVGDSVIAFYREFKNQGMTHDKSCRSARRSRRRSKLPRWARNSPSAAIPPSRISRRSTRSQQGLHRTLPQVRERSEAAVTHHAHGKQLLPGFPLEAGASRPQVGN